MVIGGGSYFGAAATLGAFQPVQLGGERPGVAGSECYYREPLDRLWVSAEQGGVDDDLASLCYDPVTQDIFLTGFYNGQYNVYGYPGIK